MVTLIINNSFSKVKCPDVATHRVIYEKLSYIVPNHKIIARKLGRDWDGKKSFYSMKNQIFLTGLLPLVTGLFDKELIPYEILDQRSGNSPLTIPSKLKLEGIELRDYQMSCITKYLKHGRGIIQAGTGAGKTEMAIAIFKHLQLPTLWLTHRVNLLHQTAQRFIDRLPVIKNKIGLIGDGQYNPNFLTIATVQTLQSAYKKNPKHVKEDLSCFNVIMVDEAHRAKSNQFSQNCMLCTNAYYRLGLTATPFMRNDAYENLMLHGCIGEVIAKVTPSELIEKGYLAKPYFKFYDVNEPPMPRITKWRDIYEIGIIDNVIRNEKIARNLESLAVNMKKKTLVIAQELQHVKNIKLLAEKRGIKVGIVTGKDTYSQRTKALKDLSRGKHHALICTNIFDEGIDSKDISAIIMAAGGKSAPAFLQRTGRAVRKKDDENYAIVVDFIDHQHPMLLHHSIQRKRFVENEPQFSLLN